MLHNSTFTALSVLLPIHSPRISHPLKPTSLHHHWHIGQHNENYTSIAPTHQVTITPNDNFPERQAPEPTLSENIIKLQIIDNHILSTMQSKSKSF